MKKFALILAIAAMGCASAAITLPTSKAEWKSAVAAKKAENDAKKEAAKKALTDAIDARKTEASSKGSAAAKAGLKLGDVITKIDDIEITSLEDLNNAKKQYSAGDTSTLTIYRDGTTTTVELTWGATPAELQTNISEDQPQNGQNGQNGQNPYYYYSSPFDMFDYFFGNPFG